MIHEVTLYRQKGSKGPVILGYVETTLRSSQARLINRTTLTPQIDLEAYQCGAVVDWIDIQIELARRTQHWHLNKRIEKLTGRKEYPEALDTTEGKTATRYKLRIQEPDFEAVRKVLNDIEGTYGFATPAHVTAIEISVDFYPVKPSEEARARMHGVLVRHFFPTTRVLRNSRMWPRFMPGSVKATDYTIGRNVSDDSLDIGDRMAPELDRPALYGSTYYVGERGDPRAMWRIQNKILDKQNLTAGAREELPEVQKRIRVEVTLGHEGCREIGLEKLADLETIAIARLQKAFFQFMKPTFSIVRLGSARSGSVAVRRKIEDYRRQRFLNAGVLGLQIRDDAREELRALEMPRIRRWHRMYGSKMKPRARVGSGAYGTMLAYEELTRIVERALAGLERRVRGEMGIKGNS
ncbi:hypothetical protein JOH50_001744 [Rhizobium leguminosarum]|uniref:hypothetical protein n=1 Tax=Rhizobium leguminosarum TaxID=384 RepID=UPI001AE8CC9F|nr:hypothetical protein [Rhizobium leguminosarum]MBP2486017.1 hypothetical protein [Rhizobium leguminosarum]